MNWLFSLKLADFFLNYNLHELSVCIPSVRPLCSMIQGLLMLIVGMTLWIHHTMVLHSGTGLLDYVLDPKENTSSDGLFRKCYLPYLIIFHD